MDWSQKLQIIANIVSIVLAIWFLLFGGRTLLEVLRDILKHQPLRRGNAGTITNILLALILLTLLSLLLSEHFFQMPNTASVSPPQPTKFITPTPSPTPSSTNASPKEILAVPFTSGLNGATTKYSYTGIVTLTVSGTGQAFNKEYSDAFYVFTINNGQTQVTGYRVSGFSLCINYQAVDHFVQSIPEYNPTHSYSLQIDAPGGFLTFGICDNGVSDNSGSFTVTIS
jgi:hypothetical protein